MFMLLEHVETTKNAWGSVPVCCAALKHMPGKKIGNYSYNKSQRDALFLSFILVKHSYVFRTDLLSIIRCLNTVFTATGVFHNLSYLLCCRLLARSGWNSILTLLTDNITIMTNTNCCEYSIKTPDDGQIHLSETCKSPFPKINWEIVHLVGFYYKNMSRCMVFWMSNWTLHPLKSNMGHVSETKPHCPRWKEKI